MQLQWEIAANFIQIIFLVYKISSTFLKLETFSIKEHDFDNKIHQEFLSSKHLKIKSIAGKNLIGDYNVEHGIKKKKMCWFKQVLINIPYWVFNFIEKWIKNRLEVRSEIGTRHLENIKKVQLFLRAVISTSRQRQNKYF